MESYIPSECVFCLLRLLVPGGLERPGGHDKLAKTKSARSPLCRVENVGDPDPSTARKIMKFLGMFAY
jgi:hypothetical protein